MSVLSQSDSIIIDRVKGAPGYDKEVVDDLNFIYKLYMYQSIYNVQLPRSRIFESHILMHSCTPKNDVSLAKEFQKHLSKDYHKYGVIGQVKYRKIST